MQTGIGIVDELGSTLVVGPGLPRQSGQLRWIDFEHRAQTLSVRGFVLESYPFPLRADA